MKLIALIPARAGSERVEKKNFRNLYGIPLINYTINAAKKSCIFDEIVVSTDIQGEARKRLIAQDVLVRNRPRQLALSNSSDCDWICDIFQHYDWWTKFDHYMILRPTSPFRTHETIKRAWKQYIKVFCCGVSMKSVQLASEYPGKMWKRSVDVEKNINFNTLLLPYDSFKKDRMPSWELSSNAFGELYAQNGCIDICPVSIIQQFRHRYIGDVIQAFFTKDFEGIDINTEIDFLFAEFLIRKIKDEKIKTW